MRVGNNDMMVIKRLISRFSAKESEKIDLEDKRLLELLGIEVGDIDVRGKKALKELTAYTCIKILAGAMGKLPLKIHQDAGGVRKATDHYMYSLVKFRPNEYMSAIDFFECVETQRNIYGNAYVHIEYYKTGANRGRVKALYPIDFNKVEVFVDSEGLYDSSCKLWYIVDVGGEQVKLKSSEVLHFKGLSTDGIMGLSPLTALKTTLESAVAGTEYINKFYQNGMQSKGLVYYNGDLNPAAEESFRKNFERMANGLKNAHRVAILPLGFQYQPLKMTLTDAQFLENTQLTIRQIAAAYGIKNHQLNDLDRATHTNISEQQQDFYIGTLMEILTKYEQEMSYKLFTPKEISEGYYLKFNADAITRADIKTRYEAYRIGVQGGFLTPNEVRDREELEAKEGGDDLYANGSTLKLKDIGKGELS